jgi:hypothetical protein
MNQNGSTDPPVELLDRKKNKMIRVILGTKERLHPDEVCGDDGAFRKIVLDEVNAFFEHVTDIVETLQQDRTIAVNQIFLDKLDELRDELTSKVG